MPSLRRLRDGAGDSGSRVEAIKYFDDGKTPPEVVGNKPMVGCCLLVGSVSARTYSSQDYWLTTPIIEILSNNKGVWRFKTKNGSEYEYKE